jgi:uncharacterized protein (TIGR03435 family)
MQALTRIISGILFSGMLSGTALSQTAATSPAFDIADVHINPKTLTPRMSGGVLRGNRFEIRNLVRTAYGVEANKVLGGPSWVELDRFDALAKAGRDYSSRSDQQTTRVEN